MARAGETPTAGFAAQGLPHGGAAEANRLAHAVPQGAPQETAAPQPQPQVPAGASGPGLEPHEEAFLFGPSDRPHEPVTAGAPVGAGPDFPQFSYESNNQYIKRVATELASQPNASPAVKAFAQRALAGG